MKRNPYGNKKSIVSNIDKALQSFENDNNARNIGYSLVEHVPPKQQNMNFKNVNQFDSSLPSFPTKFVASNIAHNFKKPHTNTNILQMHQTNKPTKNKTLTKEEYAKKYEVKELTLTLTASEENCNNENLNKKELKDSSIKHTNIKIIEPENPAHYLKNTEHLSNRENVPDMILFNAKELKTKFEEFPVFIDKISDEYFKTHQNYKNISNNFNLQVDFINELKQNISKYQTEINTLYNDNLKLSHCDKLNKNEIDNLKIQKEEVSKYLTVLKEDRKHKEEENINLTNKNKLLLKELEEMKNKNFQLQEKNMLLKSNIKIFTHEKQLIERKVKELENEIVYIREKIVSKEIKNIYRQNIKHKKNNISYRQELHTVKKEISINMRKIKSVRDNIEMILIEHTKVRNNYMRNIEQKENIIDQTKITIIDTNVILNKMDGIKHIKNDLTQILNKYLLLKKQHTNKISTLTKTIDTQKNNKRIKRRNISHKLKFMRKQ